jgi:poly(3-hydroxybutyrate) depolymerase
MQPSFITAGHFIDGFYTDGYGTRAYKLYLPSGYCGQALALLAMLHGCY